MEYAIRMVDFKTVLPLWRLLWPNRKSPIKPLSTMLHLGGYDSRIPTLYGDQARYFGAFDGKTLIGVISAHPTSALHYRTRGVYVRPEHKQHGIGQRLVLTAFDAAVANGQAINWMLPRVSNIKFFQKCGFQILPDPVRDEFEYGPHVYAMRRCT